jgi:hypothetical protein
MVDIDEVHADRGNLDQQISRTDLRPFYLRKLQRFRTARLADAYRLQWLQSSPG